MADAGLTNGAFYAHFESKEDLVANAVADAASRAARELQREMPVEQIVRAYLSIEHRDNPEDGCPSAALLDEIGRSTDATKRAYTDGLLDVIDDIAARLAPDDPRSARVKTLSVFALMVGTLAGLPRPGRPAARRRGPRAGHPERPRTTCYRASKLTRSQILGDATLDLVRRDKLSVKTAAASNGA